MIASISWPQSALTSDNIYIKYIVNMIYGLCEKIKGIWEQGTQDNTWSQRRETDSAEEMKEWRKLRSY